MSEECLICKAKLQYLAEDEMMECAICRKRELSKTRCVSGHYVCSDCHTTGMDSIFGLCLEEKSTDPLVILENMMAMPFCHMHGPEHHVMVGAALLTAYKNAGGACGFWGACGAGVSAGQFLAIATESTPLASEPWGLSNRMTAKALESIGKNGGPRCCKRDSYLAVLSAIDFAAEHLHVRMEKTTPVCTRSRLNNQCIGKRCPFFGGTK